MRGEPAASAFLWICHLSVDIRDSTQELASFKGLFHAIYISTIAITYAYTYPLLHFCERFYQIVIYYHQRMFFWRSRYEKFTVTLVFKNPLKLGS